MKIMISVVFACCFYFSGLSADKFTSFTIHHGFLLPHHASMKGLQSDHLRMFEAEIGFPFYRDRKTDALYHFPSTSLVLSYSGFGNPDILGHAFCFVPSISFTHGGNQHFRFGFRGGMGLAYLPKVFSIENNFRNTALSNKVNAAVFLRYGFDIYPSRKWSFSAGLGFSHFSNGSFSVPNLGINLLTVYTRLAINQPCIPRRTGFELRDSLVRSFSPHRKWVFMVSGALKEVYPVLSQKFPVFHSQIGLWHQLSPKGAWITALGIYYDQSLRHHLLNDENPGNDRIIIWQAGAEGGYVFMIHRLLIPVQVGVYFFDQYKRNGALYSRLGLRYQISKHLAAGITLKTHYFKASFFDLGLTYLL